MKLCGRLMKFGKTVAFFSVIFLLLLHLNPHLLPAETVNFKYGAIGLSALHMTDITTVVNFDTDQKPSTDFSNFLLQGNYLKRGSYNTFCALGYGDNKGLKTYALSFGADWLINIIRDRVDLSLGAIGYLAHLQQDSTMPKVKPYNYTFLYGPSAGLRLYIGQYGDLQIHAKAGYFVKDTISSWKDFNGESKDPDLEDHYLRIQKVEMGGPFAFVGISYAFLIQQH